MKKGNLFYSLIIVMVMMIQCPQGMWADGIVKTENMPVSGTGAIIMDENTQCKIYDDGGATGNYSNNCNGSITVKAPDGYALKITGTCVTEDDENSKDILMIGTKKFCGNQSAINVVINNPSKIFFTSNESGVDEGFELTLSMVPFISGITYRAVKSASGNYTLVFTFAKNAASTATRYKVKEGDEELGTISGSETSFNIYNVEAGIHTYTFTDGTNSVDVKCSLDVVLMPVSGSKSYTLAEGEKIKIYDDGGDDGYSNNCKDTINLSAPKGYAIKLTGTYKTDDNYDILKIDNKEYDGTSQSISQVLGNPGVISFTSDSRTTGEGFELAATTVPFISGINYTTEAQPDGTYHVNFSFVNMDASVTYTVKEGDTELGTISHGATSFQVENADIGDHTYTFINGENSIDIDCSLAVMLMPITGTTNYELKSGERIKLYDDGGANSDYSCYCDGKITFTAPAYCTIKVSGTCLAESYDYLYVDGTRYNNDGIGAGNSLLPVTIEQTTTGNSCVIRFTSDNATTYDGFQLVVTAMYSPVITLNSAGYATYSSDKDFVVATEGVNAYTAKAYYDDAEDKNVIELKKVEDDEYVPAGTGVILWGEGKAGVAVYLKSPDTETKEDNFNFLNATTDAAGNLATIGSYGTWNKSKGYWDNIWVLGDGAQMLHYSGSDFIHNRAFMQYTLQGGSSSAKAMKFVFADDTATGVETTHSAEFTGPDSNSYNLVGQRVRSYAKGLMIRNGKKFYNK